MQDNKQSLSLVYLGPAFDTVFTFQHLYLKLKYKTIVIMHLWE
jgi:hypothetical protein